MTNTTEKGRVSRKTKSVRAELPVKVEREANTGRFEFKLVTRRGAKKTVVVVGDRERSAEQTLRQLIGLNVRSKRELVSTIRQGFPVATFSELSNNLGITEKDLGQYTDVSPRTLARRKIAGHFQSDESDRIARIAMLLEEVIELFDGDREKATHWFKTPKRALAGATPIEYADTEPGAQEVRNLIGRLEHGVIA